MTKNLNKLVAEKESYDLDSQAFIESLQFVAQEVSAIEEMKETLGWKLLEKKVREELQARILVLVKDDLNINTLLALLKVTDTKNLKKTLENEIEKILPE